MIQNQRQFDVTKAQIARLEGAIDEAAKAEGQMDPRIYKAMIGRLQWQVQIMRDELREFEELSRADSLHLDSMRHIAQLLIRARIARGYTQKDLADRLGLKPQQIQRYESTDFRAVSLKRLLAIMNALDIDFEASVALRADTGSTTAGLGTGPSRAAKTPRKKAARKTLAAASRPLKKRRPRTRKKTTVEA